MKRIRVIGAGASALVVFGGAAFAIAAGSSSGDQRRVTVAASAPGAPTTRGARIVVTDETTTAAITAAPTPEPVAPPPPALDPCGVCTVDTVAPTTPPFDTDPQPGNFDGTLTVGRAIGEPALAASDATVVAGQDVWVTLRYRNITDHLVDISNGSLQSLAMVCASDLSADGHTDHALVADRNLIYVTNPPADPGAEGGEGPQALPMTEADVGPMTCEGVVLASTADPVHIAARITNIAPVSFTVVAAPPGTTVPAPTGPTAYLGP